MSAGRMALCTDPQGAFFSLWQPLDNIGCAVVNEPDDPRPVPAGMSAALRAYRPCASVRVE